MFSGNLNPKFPKIPEKRNNKLSPEAEAEVESEAEPGGTGLEPLTQFYQNREAKNVSVSKKGFVSRGQCYKTFLSVIYEFF